ncbi:MAG: AAA family ATPase [Chitinophagaceae bacterium]|nr:AAA family ATPase [Chitinophagaceae bacterium]
MKTDDKNINFQLAEEFIHYTNRSIFLTGKAGTGKTTFLKYIKEHATKQIAVVAPTGVAAINAGGVTIHSFFQLPFTPYVPAKLNWSNSQEYATDKQQLLSKTKLNKERIAIIQKLELLIIDEVSMVRCDVLDALDTILRHYRNQHQLPFGGLQVLFIGDLYQLPPVVPQQEWSLLSQYYASPYFFDSLVMKETEPAYIELEKIYRQDDEVFINLLNKIRNNNLDQSAYDILLEHYNPEFNASTEDGFITLTTHNLRADTINSEAMGNLKSTSYFFKASIEDDFGEKIYPVDENLELKLGAQVMFTKNDLDKNKRYFNGKIGTITKINEDEIFVKCKDDADEIKVEKYRWENIKYTLNIEKQTIEENVIGAFIQYPLRLAWAITIHKSQGLTFDKAIIDAGSAFAPGQVYVALSRCRSLNGIVLVSKITNSSLHIDENIANYCKKNKINQLKESLEFEKKLHQFSTLQNLFQYKKEEQTLTKLQKLVEENRNSLTKSSFDFTEALSQQIHQLLKVGNRFTHQLNSLDNNKLSIEDNIILQERFRKAAIYFIAELNQSIKFIENCTIESDNKNEAKNINAILKTLFEYLVLKKYYLENLKDGFAFNQYLKLKKEFTNTLLHVNVYSGKSTTNYQHKTHPILYNKLRELRDEICEDTGEDIFMVASTKSLDEMATYLPQSKAALQQITGFGKVKVEQYGFIFLEAIINYCQQNNLESLIHTKTITTKKELPKKENKPSSKDISFQLFKSGKTILEIATERNLATSTIESHLLPFVSSGEIKIEEILPYHKIGTIEKVLKENEDRSSLTSIKEILGESYSFSEIRFVNAHIDFQNSKIALSE